MTIAAQVARIENEIQKWRDWYGKVLVQEMERIANKGYEAQVREWKIQYDIVENSVNCRVSVISNSKKEIRAWNYTHFPMQRTFVRYPIALFDYDRISYAQIAQPLEDALRENNYRILVPPYDSRIIVKTLLEVSDS
jgi:hypothetical protein